jgi:hypothetical protein
MARIRTIKPEFGHHDKLSALPAEVHLFAALLLTYADDAGYFPAHSKLLHAALCPLRELSLSIPEILRSLKGIGYIELFQGTDGREYGYIVNFLKHQWISHPSSSKIALLRKTPEDSRSATEPLRTEGEGEVEVEREREAPPESFHPMQYAIKLLEMIGLPQTTTNCRTVAEAIRSEAQFTGREMEAVCETLAAKIRDDRDEGVPIDKFYFEDAKWRRNGKQPAISASAARANRTKQNIIDGITTEPRRRTTPKRPECEVGAGKRLGGGIQQ